jgi:D-alanyl-D-alanine dipeptidase
MNLFCLPLALQLVVVVTPDWNAREGTLYRYERSSTTDKWHLLDSSVTIHLGKNGMAWGRGLHVGDEVSGEQKREGDGKSPAGIFSLGPVFGDAEHQMYAKKMPFLEVTEDLECVDDPASSFYNQFVTSRSNIPRDWKSSEQMKQIGLVYALGVVIAHNVDPIEPGMGSCIFMHIWGATQVGTPGCTVMEESDLIPIISWLDETKHPCLVQLPIEEYKNKKEAWGLP